MIRNSETKLSITSSTISSEEGEDSGSNSSSSSSSNSDSSDSENDDSGSKVETTSVSDFWKELEETLSGIVGDKDGRFVRISPQTSSVSIRAMPDEIKAVKDYLQLAENSLKRQVIIEAKLLEVTLDEGYEQGINWGMVLNGSNSSLKINENAPFCKVSFLFNLLLNLLFSKDFKKLDAELKLEFISAFYLVAEVYLTTCYKKELLENEELAFCLPQLHLFSWYLLKAKSLKSSNSDEYENLLKTIVEKIPQSKQIIDLLK
jgi:hypothetical protein